jgi:hypothetical protein
LYRSEIGMRPPQAYTNRPCYDARGDGVNCAVIQNNVLIRPKRRGMKDGTRSHFNGESLLSYGFSASELRLRLVSQRHTVQTASWPIVDERIYGNVRKESHVVAISVASARPSLLRFRFRLRRSHNQGYVTFKIPSPEILRLRQLFASELGFAEFPIRFIQLIMDAAVMV